MSCYSHINIICWVKLSLKIWTFTSNTNSIYILSRSENDRGHLRPVPPLCQGGHGERLHKDLGEQSHRRHLRRSRSSWFQRSLLLLLLLFPQLLPNLLKLLLALIGWHVVAFVKHFQPKDCKESGGDIVCYISWYHCGCIAKEGSHHMHHCKREDSSWNSRIDH